MKLGVNIIDVQRKNRCIVLQALMAAGEISRVDLARITELNKATITNIIREFLEIGIVKEIGQIESSNGRKVAGIRLEMRDAVSVILSIRKDRFGTAICNMRGEIEHYVQIPYRDDNDINKILKQYKEEIEKQVEYCREKHLKIMGLAAATLGWLYRENGHYYIHATNAPVLAEVDIKETLEQMFPNMEVWVDHDANMSALAEWNVLVRKQEKMPESLLSIVGGLGFGGGIIIRGEVYGGYNGIAGEVGHMGINCITGQNGKYGNFRGTWENYASPFAIRELVLENRMDYPDTIISEHARLDEIYEAYEKGDDLAEWVMNRSARYMAYGITSLVFILNPEVIVLGDEIIRSEKYEKQLWKYLKQNLPELLYKKLNIKFSEMGESGILVGAGIAMVKHYLRTYKMIDFITECYSEK